MTPFQKEGRFLHKEGVICVSRDSREEALGEYYMRKYAKPSGGEQ